VSNCALPSVDFDVVIAGGGPAGLCTALELRRWGHRVCVVERGSFEEPRIGEHLSARGVSLVASMGLGSHWDPSEHLPSPGMISVWGGAEPVDLPAFFRPEGAGVHIARPAFEQGLALALMERGGEVRTRSRLEAIRREGDVFAIEVHSLGKSEELFARFLVDATGRPAAIARRLGRKVVHRDRLIGLCASSPGAHRVLEPMVEATPAGWWYSSSIPDGRAIAIYFTDADLREGETLSETWARALMETSLSRSRLGEEARAWRPRGIDAGTQSLGGPPALGCVAVGDAALALDPLSSSGLTRAIEGGKMAALALHRAGGGDLGALARYESELGSALREHQAGKARYYGLETRFLDEPFWQRRHALRAPIARILSPKDELCWGLEDAAVLPLASLTPDIPVSILRDLAEKPCSARCLAETLRSLYQYDDTEIVQLLHALVHSRSLRVLGGGWGA
jgi:flavin-dependent dehydrogenase